MSTSALERAAGRSRLPRRSRRRTKRIDALLAVAFHELAPRKIGMKNEIARWLAATGRVTGESRCRAELLLLPRRLLLAELLDHLLLRRARDGLVLGELHRELALALRRGPEVRRVAEHLRERDVGGADHVALDRLGRLDDAAALVDLADHRALELLGRLHFHVHDRLENDRLRLVVALAEAHQCGRLEGLLAGVDRVGEAIVDDAAHADHREADERSLLDGLLEALVAGRDELARNRSAGDVVDELVLLDGIGRQGLEVSDDASELARSAGLLLVRVVEVGLLLDGLAVGDLRLADRHFAAVLALDAFHVDLEVQLSHAGGDGLRRLLVAMDAEGGILAGEAVQRLGEVGGACLLLGSDGERDDRVGNVHRGHRVVHGAVGEGIARRAVDPEEGDDVARRAGIDVVHLIRVHADEARNLHLLAVALVDDEVALRDPALVDADISELPVAAVLELEREAHERLRLIARQNHLGLGVALIVRLFHDLLRIREVVDDAVEELLHALVLVGGAAEDRSELELERALADGAPDHLHRRLLFLDEHLGQLVIEVGGRGDEIVPVLLALVEDVGRDVLDADGLAVLAVVIDGLHADEVDDALELVLGANRVLDHDGVVVQLLAQLLRDAEGVRAGAVHPVDEREARDLVAAHLPVDGDRLRLHPRDRAENEDGAVEDAERALHLDGEVDVSRGVDDVDVVGRARLVRDVPLAVRGGGLDGDALLALQFHRVHLGADRVLPLHLVDRVDPAGVIEDALGQRRLTRIDVGADADVADEVDVRHVDPSLWLRPGLHSS